MQPDSPGFRRQTSDSTRHNAYARNIFVIARKSRHMYNLRFASSGSFRPPTEEVGRRGKVLFFASGFARAAFRPRPSAAHPPGEAWLISHF
jgi:hypothetical protein